MTVDSRHDSIQRPAPARRGARSLAAKFPAVPLHAWSAERRARLLWLTALLWSASMLLGGALGAGLLG